MKWKKKVRVTKEDGYRLESTFGTQRIRQEDEYIVRELERGIQDDNLLLDVIMLTEHTNEIDARFRLAAFLVEYGDYIEEMTGYEMIVTVHTPTIIYCEK